MRCFNSIILVLLAFSVIPTFAGLPTVAGLWRKFTKGNGWKDLLTTPKPKEPTPPAEYGLYKSDFIPMEPDRAKRLKNQYKAAMRQHKLDMEAYQRAKAVAQSEADRNRAAAKAAKDDRSGYSRINNE